VVALAAIVVLGIVSGLPAAAAATQPSTWNFREARIPAAQALGNDGAGVVVAVVDTWVDASHPDFGGRVLPGADCVSGACRPGPAAPDGCYHGTHVAGLVSSRSYGVAPAARILPVRVLSGHRPGHCSGSLAAVSAAIRWATARGADVINLSIGTAIPAISQSRKVAAAVHAAARAGVVVVFAAGNTGAPLADSYDGDAIIVAATGPNGSLASYSQRGAGVTLAAPGGDAGSGQCSSATCVVSTFPHGRYAALEGTSMAAPHVSGLAALLVAAQPSRSRAKTVQLMTQTARPLPGAGYGLIDAAAALHAAQPATQRTRRAGGNHQQQGHAADGASPSGVSGAGADAAPHPVATTRSSAGQAPRLARSHRPQPVASGSHPGDIGPGARHRDAGRAAQQTDPPLAAIFVAAGLIVAVALSLLTVTRPRDE
jgi:subtilisin family serine protease